MHNVIRIMKKIRNIGLSSIIVLLLFGSCKKESVDFRDKYCGKWNFKTIYHYSTGDDSYFDTVYFYQGNIWYETEGTINIEYRENNVSNSIINTDGELIDDFLYDNVDISGKFMDEKNVSIEIKTFGNGFGITQIVTGNRNK